MNVYDARRMADVLAPLGYANVETPEDADLIILNTCHIREKAAEKVYSELGRLRQLKGERQDGGDPMMIGVAGCVAQAEGKEMLRRAPYVYLVLGPQTYHRLPEMIARALREEGAYPARAPQLQSTQTSIFDIGRVGIYFYHGVSVFWLRIVMFQRCLKSLESYRRSYQDHLHISTEF